MMMNFKIDLKTNSIKPIIPSITSRGTELNLNQSKESSYSPVTPSLSDFFSMNDEYAISDSNTDSIEHKDDQSNEWSHLEDNRRFSVGNQIAETMQGGIFRAIDLKHNKMCVLKSADSYLVDSKQNYDGQSVTENFIKERHIMLKLSLCTDFHPGHVKLFE